MMTLTTLTICPDVIAILIRVFVFFSLVLPTFYFGLSSDRFRYKHKTLEKDIIRSRTFTQNLNVCLSVTLLFSLALSFCLSFRPSVRPSEVLFLLHTLLEFSDFLQEVRYL